MPIVWNCTKDEIGHLVTRESDRIAKGYTITVSKWAP